MASLQRSSNTFRREGSSGLVWDDNLLIEQMLEKGDYGELRHCQSTTQGIRIAGPNDVRVMDVGGGSNGASSSYLPRSSSASVANIRSKKCLDSDSAARPENLRVLRMRTRTTLSGFTSEKIWRTLTGLPYSSYDCVRM